RQALRQAVRHRRGHSGGSEKLSRGRLLARHGQPRRDDLRESRGRDARRDEIRQERGCVEPSLLKEVSMYGADDPRSRLSTASKSDSSNASAFGVSTYARFYETEPQLANEHERTWYARGQNFLVAYSEVRAGARLVRENQL